ncbi:MAG: ABC transporter permease [Gemmatimonadaceae bacterium]
MDRLIQDVRFAARTLAGAPLVTTLCVLCLAIGIGVNSNIYSAVYAAFLRPFGFAEPERLVSVEESFPQRGWRDVSLSYETLKDLREGTTGFEQLAASSFRSLTLGGGDEPIRVRSNLVTWNLFPLLGVSPMLGRQFRPDDDVPGAPAVLMLGHGVWERRFSSDSTIVGRAVTVDNEPYLVIGVMPRGFRFPFQEEAWVPMAPRLDGRPRAAREVRVYGKLNAGTDAATASTQVAAVSQRLAELHPEMHEGWRAYAEPLREELMDENARLSIAAMMGAVTFVLLIACANVANLLLARANSRRREIAVRTALGAGRGRIIRQLLTESVLLSLVACPLGIGISYWMLDLVKASIPEGQMPYYIVFEINGPVLLYTVAIALLTGLIFGIVPAIQAARGDLQAALRDGGRGSGAGAGRQRLRSALVVGEVAMSLVLLVGAALFVRSFLNLQTQTGGVEVANLLTTRFFLPGERYAAENVLSARVEDVVQRVEAIPGVLSATASNLIPLSGGGGGGSLEIEGKPSDSPAAAPRIFWAGVTEHWFATIGVPIVGGRTFTATEARDSSAVAVINQTMASRFWPDVNPLGQRFRLLDDSSRHWFTVIGVARDFMNEELDDDARAQPAFFVSYRYMPTRNTGLVVRAEGDPVLLASAVRSAITAADPTLPVFETMSMEEVRRMGFWAQRLFGWMFSMFGIIALLLASVGVYGVISYGVSQRTQEFGVRLALGAQAGDVIRLVVRNGALLALTGIGIGLAGALAVTRVIQRLLFDVSPVDPLSFISVTLFLAAVALLASYVPARRATRVDPLTALRHE